MPMTMHGRLLLLSTGCLDAGVALPQSADILELFCRPLHGRACQLPVRYRPLSSACYPRAASTAAC